MPESRDSSSKEVSFLPPLKMILSFFDRESKKRVAEKAEEKVTDEKTVTQLIEKLSEKENKD